MFRPRLEALEERWLPAPLAALDPSFGSSGTVDGSFTVAGTKVQVTREVVQPDGKLLLAGPLTGGASVLRLDAAGKLDPTFGSGGLAQVSFPPDGSGSFGGLALDSQGRIVVGSHSETFGPAQDFFAAARLTPSGQLDSSFGTAGFASVALPINAALGNVAIGPGDQILLSGGANDASSPTAAAYVVRLTASGAADASFGTGGLATISYGKGTSFAPEGGTPGQDLFVRPTGGVLLAGSLFSGQQILPVVTLLTPSGALDPTYGGGAGFTLLSSFASGLTAATAQPDGSVIVGGTLPEIRVPTTIGNTAQDSGLERLTPTGAVDTTFGEQGMRRLPLPLLAGFTAVFESGDGSSVSQLAVQPDGKIVVLLLTETFSRFGTAGNLSTYFLRYLPNGDPDPSFGTSQVEQITPGTALNLAVQPDGKYVVVGSGSSSPSQDFASGGPAYYVQRYLGGTAPVPRAISAVTVDPATETWYMQQTAADGTTSVGTFQYGLPGWKPVLGDWDGDGVKGIGVFDPSTGKWYLKPADSDTVTTFAYGAPGWLPVVGDWNSDGVTTVGVVDPRTMTWYLSNNNSAGSADAGVFQYGLPGWVPVVGDWTDSYQTTVGVVDPATMTWYLRNSITPGAPDITPFQYGAPGWTPVVGDWGLTFTSTPGVVNPSTATWYLRKSNDAGDPDAGTFPYGVPGWAFLAGPF